MYRNLFLYLLTILGLTTLGLQGVAAQVSVSHTGVAITNMKFPGCVIEIMDGAGGACLDAASIPTSGSFVPLSQDFNVSANGYVGLGTVTPGAPLSIKNDPTFPNLSQILISNDSTTTGQSLFSFDGLAAPDQYFWDIQTAPLIGASRLTFRDNLHDQNTLDIRTDNKLRFNADVGIGTTTPATKLDVAGDIAVNGTKLISATGAWLGGSAGLQGQKGATGPIGPKGPQGDQGPQGVVGATGVDGATGPAGNAGPKGPKGNQGATGAQGPMGVIVDSVAVCQSSVSSTDNAITWCNKTCPLGVVEAWSSNLGCTAHAAVGNCDATGSGSRCCVCEPN
jgi:hypothetical protein